MKLGVQEDYFSADGEEFLCQKIEKPLSTLRDNVLGFISGTADKVELPAEDEQLLRRYFYLSTSRSKSALNFLKSHSVISQFMPEQVNHDLFTQPPCEELQRLLIALHRLRPELLAHAVVHEQRNHPL